MWSQLAPHLPQPKTDDEAEAIMHLARTETWSIPLRPRAYSHRWLLERGLPSRLPDRLKPRAERLYPQVVEGVGISLNTNKEWLKPAIPIIRGAMEDAVSEAYADGRTNPDFVRTRMQEARSKATLQLFGRIGQ